MSEMATPPARPPFSTFSHYVASRFTHIWLGTPSLRRMSALSLPIQLSSGGYKGSFFRDNYKVVHVRILSRARI